MNTADDDEPSEEVVSKTKYLYFIFLLIVVFLLAVIISCILHRRHNLLSEREYKFWQFRWAYNPCKDHHEHVNGRRAEQIKRFQRRGGQNIQATTPPQLTSPIPQSETASGPTRDPRGEVPIVVPTMTPNALSNSSAGSTGLTRPSYELYVPPTWRSPAAMHSNEPFRDGSDIATRTRWTHEHMDQSVDTQGTNDAAPSTFVILFDPSAVDFHELEPAAKI